MSKKKINNRLDKLFEDIEKEPESNQASDLEYSQKKVNKDKSSSLLISTAGKSPDPEPNVEFPHLAETRVAQESINQTPSTMLSTAFRTDGRNWATLKVFDESKQQVWGAEEQLLIKQVADQLSLALENARLFQEAQRRAREMTALADVAREISATLELQQVMERISNQALVILNATASAVYVPDPQFQMLIAITAIGGGAGEIKADTVKVGEGTLGRIAFNKVAEIVNNISVSEGDIPINLEENSQYMHLMAAPILSQNLLSGLLVVWRAGESEQFAETEQEFLVSLAQQAAIAVENARLFEETQEHAEELSVLNEMARELSAEMNVNRIAETAHHYISRLIDTTNFYIAFYDEDSDLISFPVNIEENERKSIPSRKPVNGLTEHIIQTKETIFLTSNVRELMGTLQWEWFLAENKEEPRSLLGVPLLLGNRAIGALTVQNFNTANLYNEHDKELMMAIASQVAVALENARLFKNAQARARREKILREITARIRATNDPEMIAKAAVRELGQALGVPAFIQLGGNKKVSGQGLNSGEANDKSKKSSPGGI